MTDDLKSAPCMGTNCGTTTAQHSRECLLEAGASQGWAPTSEELSAAPAAPVDEASERELFEATLSERLDGMLDFTREDALPYPDRYKEDITDFAWEAWLARAQLVASVPAAEPVALPDGFSDASTATPLEKARRMLASLADER